MVEMKKENGMFFVCALLLTIVFASHTNYKSSHPFILLIEADAPHIYISLNNKYKLWIQ